jgi:hypothetical protein
MRPLTDADVWQLKKFFRRALVAASIAGVVTALMMATD